MRIFTRALVFLLLLLVTDASAQTKNDKKALYIHSLLGVSSPGVNNLNRTLRSSGHLPLASAYFARGGGLYAFFSNTRLVSLFTFSTYSGNRTEGSRRNWVKGTQIDAAFGIDMKRRGRLQAIPFVGAAYGLMDIRLNNTLAGSNLFGSYLGGSANLHHVSMNQWLGNIGMHLGASPVGHKGFAHKLDLALRTGYHLPLSQGRWKTPGQRLGNGPDVNSGGFYASVVLGIRQ